MPSSRLATALDRLAFGSAGQRCTAALTAFAALLFPSSCVLCGAWNTSLCGECLGAFRQATARPFRAEAGAESLPDVPLGGMARTGTTPACRSPDGGSGVDEPGGEEDPYGPLPVVAAGRYARTVSGVLLAYKNHGHVDLVAPIAAAAAGALHAAVAGLGTEAGEPSAPLLLVPVPSRASSRRRRGYDPLMLLLTRLERGRRLPAGTLLVPALRQISPIVRLVAGTRAGGRRWNLPGGFGSVLPALRGGQKGLGRRRRQMQVLNSMAPAPRTGHPLAGSSCLIVDDVLTTGATIGEAHRVLVANGARVLGAVVVAATSSPVGSAMTGSGGRGGIASVSHRYRVSIASGTRRSFRSFGVPRGE